MRLLHVRDFSFRTFQQDVKPYAILSHRWTASETMLEDIVTGRVGRLSTPNKVSRFAQYIERQFPDIEWIWVDTCCIDQKNLAEVQEAVNSMYDWYRNAAVCIVYLFDVEHASDEVTLRNSVWFKRGWTLQELLASTVAVFLTAGWQVIGHKGNAAHLETNVGRNIETLLAERTKVPLAVLQDMSVSRLLSVEERLRWMEGRDTERKEDMFYALYGIFDVAPGINYGEKKHRARQRLLKAIDEEHGNANLALKSSSQYNKTGSLLTEGAADEEMDAAKTDAWLSPADPSTNHASARERHESGTCTWLLQQEQYKAWRTGTKRHLWLHGKPGCGKSVLCSTVIEDLQVYRLDHSNTGLAYFYFTFSDDRKQSYDELILSLTAQFRRREPARSMLRKLRATKQSKPSTQELETILLPTVATFQQAIIVLDALDESPELSDTRRDLLKRLNKLLSQTSRLRLFTTSRSLQDIRDFMEDLSSEQIPIHPCDVSGDIQRYVTAQLSTEPRLRRFTPAIKAKIESNVSDNADGMFRWAFLLLDQLAKLKNSKPSVIAFALNQFPKGLDDIYARILQDIQEDDRQDALTLLHWITYARNPLSLGQLVDTLIIKTEDESVQVDDRCQPDYVFRLLTSLVVPITDSDDEGKGRAGILIDESTRIRLAHFTVQEYLESMHILKSDAREFRLESKAGHHFLARGCLTYILHYSSSDDKESTREDLTTFPLLYYAARSWYHHSLLHGYPGVDLELKLLGSDAAMSAWLVIHKPDQEWKRPFKSDAQELGTSLYFACFLGLKMVVKLLLEKNANVNAEGGKYGSALPAASGEGHVEVVKLLLEKNANVNAEGGKYGSALQAASEGGHVEVVKLLLEKNANVNAGGGKYGSALQAASEGHVGVVTLLLEKNANVNAEGGYHGSALQVASRGGHVGVVKRLLEKNANVNAEGSHYGSALQAASGGGHVEVVKLLLEKNANVNAEGGMYGSALQVASEGGHVEVVKLLLEKNANVNAEGGKYGSALQAASRRGHVEVVRLLLEKNANVNAGGGKYDSALQVASKRGHVEVVKLLLEKNANVNAEGGKYGSALQAASGGGHVELVTLLLEKNANVNAEGGKYGSALQAASYGGHVEVVELLLEMNANVNAPGGNYGSALQAASGGGHVEVMTLLLVKNANVNAEGGNYGSALQVALVQGEAEIIKAWIENDAQTLRVP